MSKLYTVNTKILIVQLWRINWSSKYCSCRVTFCHFGATQKSFGCIAGLEKRTLNVTTEIKVSSRVLITAVSLLEVHIIGSMFVCSSVICACSLSGYEFWYRKGFLLLHKQSLPSVSYSGERGSQYSMWRGKKIYSLINYCLSKSSFL